MNQERLERADEKEGLGEKVLKSEYPLWWKLLNLQASDWEWSNYLKQFRLKNLNILRKLAPGLYSECEGEVKEFREFTDLHGNKVKLGKRIGSIPLIDYFAHPELHKDANEQDRYWREHPEFKT